MYFYICKRGIITNIFFPVHSGTVMRILINYPPFTNDKLQLTQTQVSKNYGATQDLPRAPFNAAKLAASRGGQIFP